MSKSIEQLVQDISNLKILELDTLVKELETAFGVSAASFGVGAGAGAGAADAGATKSEEKSEFKVELLEAGAEKIKVIKALREIKKDMSLGDAKAAVDNAPFVIAEAVSKDEANAMKEKLEAAGAKVKLA
jgi:large subunit ribosomal protein L7/L12